MDRHRGDRHGGDRGGSSGDDDDMPRRMRSFRRANESPPDDHRRFPRGGGGSGGRFHPYRAPEDYSPGGGGGPGFRDGPGGGFGHGGPMGGPKRGFLGRGGGSPDYADVNKFVKLFVGSVPRTATEEDIRPLFEEHGNVIEVALIKDKRTGQQLGFCFVKYTTMEEADRAIAALHQQYTLPGALAPLQVRYADGDRERHEDKLFVASLNKRATEQEIAEVFSPYGHVEDVYLMRDELRQSRGCCFVKFSNREMAAAAMNALHGTYIMRGCDQPLIVRFADPKRPRPEARVGPAFGGPGFGRSEAPIPTGPSGEFDEPIGGHMPPNAWRPVSPQSRGPSIQGFGTNPSIRGGLVDTSSTMTGNSGETGGTKSNFGPTSLQQGFNPSMAQMHPIIGQQMLPLQKPFMPPQSLSSQLQPLQNQQIPGSYTQAQTQLVPGQHVGQLQAPQSTGLPSNQTLPPQQLPGLSGQLSTSQPFVQQSASATAMLPPMGQPQQGMTAVANQHQLPPSISQQLLQHPMQQMPSQIPPGLLQQQAQSLQSSVQSSRQAIFQLQQQLQLIQQQHISQNTKQQPQWNGQQVPSSTPASAPAISVPSAGSMSSSLPINAAPALPLTCNWTEHTSPQGFKYYYNSVTQESKWEKPEEYSIFEQQQQQQQQQKLLLLQQQQQNLTVQQLQSPVQAQSQTQIQSNQSNSQTQQLPTQMQLRQQAPMHFLQPSLAYQTFGVGNHQIIQDFNYAQLQAANSVADTARTQQQGMQAAPELTWQNKPAGS